MRALHKAYAKLMGYFWLPCPVCGKEHGGHEVVWAVPLIIDDEDGYERAMGVCSVECGYEAERTNQENGRFWPIPMSQYPQNGGKASIIGQIFPL